MCCMKAVIRAYKVVSDGVVCIQGNVSKALIAQQK